MKGRLPISVTMLTKNSEKYLEASLRSLEPFDEVVVLDNGSEDETLKIAAKFPNVTIHTHPFTGFGPMKNLAAKKARNDWILSVDSDEVLSEELAASLAAADLSRPETVFLFDRLNHYRQKPVRCCGWYPDTVMRLYNRTHTAFSDAMVHESLLIRPDTVKKRLEGKLLHYPFDGAASLLEKLQRYSDLFAEQSDKRSSPAKAFWRALFAFFKNYFLQRGFLCGYEGLLISVSNANGVFYKYIKLYEKSLEEKA
jgi:glycosyltransferase involved in cell wall biosynthesis